MELASLTIADFKKVSDYLERCRQTYTHQSIKALFAHHESLAPVTITKERTYLESEIIAELGAGSSLN